MGGFLFSSLAGAVLVPFALRTLGLSAFGLGWGYRQSVTPDRLQGRMNARMLSINRAMVVIGAPIGSVLGDALGFRSMIWIAAVGLGLLAAALARS